MHLLVNREERRIVSLIPTLSTEDHSVLKILLPIKIKKKKSPKNPELRTFIPMAHLRHRSSMTDVFFVSRPEAMTFHF
jgi:hypothetical protein